MLTLDGAYAEGGGQILRTALVLSLLTDQAFRIDDIRRGRPQPGLKSQHVHIVHGVVAMSNGRVAGLRQGATTLTFWPGKLVSGAYSLDIGTAGAIPLVLQTLLPVAMFSGAAVEWTLMGGTDVRGAMTMDFWIEALLPFVRRYASSIYLRVHKPGYYPAGGGRVELAVEPRFSQENWVFGRAAADKMAIPKRGRLLRTRVISRAEERLRERRVAERQLDGFLQAYVPDSMVAECAYGPTRSLGSSITAIAEYEHTRLGADGLGERNVAAEQVGAGVAARLLAEMRSTGTVDVHSADNLLLWLALFGGGFHFAQVTGHMQANAYVIEQFLPGTVRINGQSAHAINR